MIANISKTVQQTMLNSIVSCVVGSRLAFTNATHNGSSRPHKRNIVADLKKRSKDNGSNRPQPESKGVRCIRESQPTTHHT